MFLWVLSSACLLFGLRELKLDEIAFFQFKKISAQLQNVQDHFLSLRETLESGFVPSEEHWAMTRSLAQPWRTGVADVIDYLRKEGTSLAPVLGRLQSLAHNHTKRLKEARSRSASALYQAWICSSIVPLCSVIFYYLLPGVQEQSEFWFFVSFIAFSLNVFACVWIFHQAENARWGGLKKKERHWILESLLFCERLIAFLKAGEVAEWAFTRALSHTSLDLKQNWVNQLEEVKTKKSLKDSLQAVGPSLRQIILQNTQSGLPSLERVLNFSQDLQIEINSYQEQELQVLPQKTLKPLFIAVAPSLLGLLMTALFLSIQDDWSGL